MVIRLPYGHSLLASEAEVVMIVEEGGSDRGGLLARGLIWGPLWALHTSVHFIAFSTLIVYCFQQTRCKRLVFALIDLFSIHFIHFSKNKSRLRSHPWHVPRRVPRHVPRSHQPRHQIDPDFKYCNSHTQQLYSHLIPNRIFKLKRISCGALTYEN